ncbi:F1/F0 ATPase, Methanosarcina type, subunit 2 [delta proteobacterium NaphS2]|nr:F1/F0 ATPase, Methanosarcina type, subunit 2 [delta proteobacterium NaphS2]
MANDVIYWGLAFLWGVLLGSLYFGGLWITLRKMPEKKKKKRWLALSYILRLCVALVGFWIVIELKGPPAFFFTLAGFFLTRFVMTRFLSPKKNEGSDHATQS